MLIDEFKARRIASVHGLVVVGTLAVLVRAKDVGLIPGVKPYIEMMQTQGRRLSEALISRMLQEAGE